MKRIVTSVGCVFSAIGLRILEFFDDVIHRREPDWFTTLMEVAWAVFVVVAFIGLAVGLAVGFMFLSGVW